VQTAAGSAEVAGAEAAATTFVSSSIKVYPVA